MNNHTHEPDRRQEDVVAARTQMRAAATETEHQPAAIRTAAIRMMADESKEVNLFSRQQSNTALVLLNVELPPREPQASEPYSSRGGNSRSSRNKASKYRLGLILLDRKLTQKLMEYKEWKLIF